MILDKKSLYFLDDLPIFFKLDADSLRKNQYILKRYPCFAMQSYLINVGAHSVRCKLHQTYLVRSNNGAKYAQGVEISLSSATEVIKINKAVRNDLGDYILQRVKFVGLLHRMC